MSLDNERHNADRPDRYRPRSKWLPDRPHKAYPGGGDVDAFGDESLYKPSLLGTACVEPSEISAGSIAPLKLIYTTGPAQLPTGTVVSFCMRGQDPLGKFPQECRIQGPDECRLRPCGLGFVVEEGFLTEGQQVILSWEPFRWTSLAGRREFKVTFAFPGQDVEQRLPEPVVVNVTPLEADRLEITLPCTHEPGEKVGVRVSVRDRFDNRVPVNGFASLLGTGVDKKDIHIVSGIGDCSLSVGDAHAIRVGAESALVAGKYVSNPSIASSDYQLYVGDLHAHDFLSEAEGYTDEVYRWAIEDRRLDFVSVIPQSHGWHDNETWTVTKYMNERFLKEGEFVTFLGFEWQHTGYGDKVVHFLGGDQPYLPVDDPRYSCPAGLYDALRESDAFVISHHTAYPPGNWCPATDFDAIDTDIERVVEIWSMHGSSEGYNNDDRPLRNMDSRYTVMEALRKGLRLGFVAGSDTHSARPGGSAKEPLGYWGGLAAVWAKDLTRRSLFEAIHARRTYALTRARIVLRMTVNDAWMGSELLASDTARIRIEAWAPLPIAKVEIVKNAELLKEFGPFGDECRIEHEDTTGGSTFYYCRVTQIDGELAVCSPVWIG